MTPQWAAGVTGVPAARIEQAAEWWGTSATGMLLHARGIEQQSKGTENVLAAINLGLATGKYGKPGSGVTTITGQGNGQGGREHGHKCDQLPGNRDITNPEHRAHVASVWGCDEAEIPGKGITAEEIIEAIHAGQIKGLLSICFNPAVSAPDTRLTAEALDKLEFYAVIDFFLSESAHHADVVLPGSLHEEDEGTATTGEGRIVKINKAVDPPGEARVDWQILVDLANRLGKGAYFPYTDTEQIFEELRLASAGGTADYRGATWQRIEDEMGLFWPIPRRAIPARHACSRAAASTIPDGKARFHAVPYREPAEVVDDEYPIWLTTGPGRQPVPVGDADPAHRWARRAVPGTVVRDAPAAGRVSSGRRRRPGHRVVPAGIDDAAGAGGQHDPARHGVHPVPLGRPPGRQPADQPGPRPDLEDARVQGRRRAGDAGRRARDDDRRA